MHPPRHQCPLSPWERSEALFSPLPARSQQTLVSRAIWRQPDPNQRQPKPRSLFLKPTFIYSRSDYPLEIDSSLRTCRKRRRALIRHIRVLTVAHVGRGSGWAIIRDEWRGPWFAARLLMSSNVIDSPAILLYSESKKAMWGKHGEVESWQWGCCCLYSGITQQTTVRHHVTPCHCPLTATQGERITWSGAVAWG